MLRPLDPWPLALVAEPQWGRQQRGYPPGGPLDCFSARCCNRLLGNADLAPLLESCGVASQWQVEAPCRVVVGGSPRQVWCDGQRVSRYQVLELAPGMRLRLGPPEGGFVGYIAAAGGLRGQPDGSFAAPPPPSTPLPPPLAAWPQRGRWAPRRGWLRCLLGPEWHPDLSPLLSAPWRVSSQRDRQGMRLEGPPAPPSYGVDIHPSPTVDGLLQLSSGGATILLRDRGTIGGYARPWALVSADIDCAAQLPPGSVVRFAPVSLSQAQAINAQQEAALPPRM